MTVSLMDASASFPMDSSMFAVIPAHLEKIHQHLVYGTAVTLIGLGSGLTRAARVIDDVARKIIRVMSDLVKNTDAVSNVLKLLEAGMKICTVAFPEVTSKFTALSAFVKNFTGFNSAKSIVQRVDSFVSGAEEKKDVPAGEFNYINVASRVCFSVGDSINAAKWLSEMRLIDGSWTKQPIAIPGLGINTGISTNGLQATTALFGFALSITSVAKKIVREGYVNLKTCLNLAGDICRLAAVVFFNLPANTGEGLGLVASGVGNLISFVNFARESAERA